MDSNKRNKTIISVLMVLTIVFTLAGGTLALWIWNSTGNTSVAFTITPDFSCSADGGEDISNEEVSLAPTKNCNGPNVIKREITLSTDITNEGIAVNLDLWLEASNVGTALANSDYFKYRLTTGEDCNEGIISSGTFTDLKTGSKNKILNSSYEESTEETYWLHIWLGHEETNNAIQNQTFNLSLGGSCESTTAPEAPVLDTGMIPVTIANDGTVATISKDDPDWYNYYGNKWANVVLVDSDSRSSYLNTTGVTVNQDDILAYYVWIPRYKYEIWTTDATKTTSPQTINIVFEDKDAAVTRGNVVGGYLTHPAFIWGGKTVAGIWVGKFESSTDTTSTCYTSVSSENCDNTDQSPRIVPNVSSLRYQRIGNQFKTSLKFANGEMSDSDGTVTFTTDENNIYGLNTVTNTTNSHMMKNSEWGAVAYLSHSEYGINKEIAINSSNSYITGYGSSSTYQYGSSTTYPQSTTGNITGIFDMSGGSIEYVMGNYGNTSHSTYFPVLPESKYYDVYSASQFTGNSSTNTSKCTLETCAGHALYETKGWYSDYAYFVNSSYPWFIRSGNFYNGTYAGVFYVHNYTGYANGGNSWRSVLIPGVDNN